MLVSMRFICPGGNWFSIFKGYPRNLVRNFDGLHPEVDAMKLYAPNIALFVIAGCLAMLGVLAAFPIELPIPGLTGNSSWYIFLAWFLLSAGIVVPHRESLKSE
jgi:hypothetical protein